MSKFKRSRDDKQSLNIQKEAAIVHAADDVVIVQAAPKPVDTSFSSSKQTKTTSVSLSHEDALLLEHLSQIEDRSQRKITSRLLREGIRAAAKQHGLIK
jgi:hypothetical protein